MRQTTLILKIFVYFFDPKVDSIIGNHSVRSILFRSKNLMIENTRHCKQKNESCVMNRSFWKRNLLNNDLSIL